MALAPRSSLRPLALLMSHGKPRLGSFFSSSSYAAAVPSTGNCAPALQPPAAPALPDRSSHRSPHNEEAVLHPLHDPPKKKKVVIKKGAKFTLENRERRVPLPCTVNEDPRHPVPDYGSCSRTPEPVPGKPERENVDHQLHDPHNRHNKKGNALLDKPSPSTPEHPVPLLCTVDEDPKHPISDGSYSSSEVVPCSDKPGMKPTKFETVTDQLPDPKQRRPRRS